VPWMIQRKPTTSVLRAAAHNEALQLLSRQWDARMSEVDMASRCSRARTGSQLSSNALYGADPRRVTR
jgi:hypothetical protein